jgi:hypothetical protein
MVHDKDRGYIGENYISGQLWSVRIDSTQRQKKIGNIPFVCELAIQQPTE